MTTPELVKSAKPTPIKLKGLLKRHQIKHAPFARELGISPGTLSDLLNWGKRPSRNWEALSTKITHRLADVGVSQCAIASAFDSRKKHQAKGRRTAEGWFPEGKLSEAKQNAQSGNSERSTAKAAVAKAIPSKLVLEGVDMLLRKQTITPATRKAFGLFRDPFGDDVACAEDVFLTPDIRYVREAMWATAKHGGLLAVIGESGAGKSTLRRDLIDRIAREQASIVVIEPYVLAMEENDIKGKTLKSAQIADAIITAISPLESPKRSSEARFRQLHQLLKNSHRSGNKHVLIIEEAHCLPTATLKHLKRFVELEDGFKKLLSIILIGQSELRTKLSEKNTEVREVVQRCEIAELAPLNNHLAEYLAFKLDRVNVKFEQIFEADAVEALREKLTFNQTARRGSSNFGTAQATSLLYPLAVANVVAAAMNLAVNLGAPLVSADIIKEV